MGVAQSAAAEALIAVSDPEAEPVIELVGLTKRFGDVTALDRVDARISGRVIGIC